MFLFFGGLQGPCFLSTDPPTPCPTLFPKLFQFFPKVPPKPTHQPETHPKSSSQRFLVDPASLEVCVVDSGQGLFQLGQGLMAFNAAASACRPPPEEFSAGPRNEPRNQRNERPTEVRDDAWSGVCLETHGFFGGPLKCTF